MVVIFHTHYNFSFITATIFTTVLYMGNNFREKLLRKSLKCGRGFSKRITLTVVCSICFMYSLLSNISAHRAAFWVLVRVSNLYTATITRQNKETLNIFFLCHKSHSIFFLIMIEIIKIKLTQLLQMQFM